MTANFKKGDPRLQAGALSEPSQFPPQSHPKHIDIIECTLRDGSYAVDFKFTERDTARMA